MLRLATIAALVALTVAVVPGSAVAAGCEVLSDPRERAECVARQQAREAARAEVQQRVDGDRGIAVAPAAGRSAAWQQALEESEGVDARELVDVRLLAAIGGLAWFVLAIRARRTPRRTG